MAIEMIVHTEAGSWFLNERGDWGVAASPDTAGSFYAISASSSTYNTICQQRQAAWLQQHPAAQVSPPTAVGSPEQLRVNWEAHKTAMTAMGRAV